MPRWPTAHGLSKTPEYRVWMNMRTRCHNRRDPWYPNYGGRGITICERWSDFAAFYVDMGPRPSPKHTIERVDNARGYSPDNCIWALRDVQNRNTRRNRYLTIGGDTKPIRQWALLLGIAPKTLYHRVDRGWSGEDLLRPARRRISAA